METIIALIVSALMNGHTSEQLTKMDDQLTITQVEVIELESQTKDAFKEMAKRDDDNLIKLGTMHASDAARIAVLEGQVKKLQIQNESLRQQMINLREYVTAD